jgi:hypothetical protein
MAKKTSLIQQRRNPFTGQMMEMVVFPELESEPSPTIALIRSDKPTSTKKSAKEGCRFGGPALLPSFRAPGSSRSSTTSTT